MQIYLRHHSSEISLLKGINSNITLFWATHHREIRNSSTQHTFTKAALILIMIQIMLYICLRHIMTTKSKAILNNITENIKISSFFMHPFQRNSQSKNRLEISEYL